MSPGEVRHRRKEPSKKNDELTGSSGKKPSPKRRVRYCLLGVVVVIAVAVTVVLLIPSPMEPVEIFLPEPPELTGPMEPNDVLKKADRLYDGVVSGPESIVVDGDHIYSGTADGWLIDMYQGNVRHILRFGPGPCGKNTGGYKNENTCGRILGIRMDRDGYLVVIDSYFGIFKVNKTTGEYSTLFSSSTFVNGKAVKFLNDLDFGSDGKIYFTSSSSKYQRNQFPQIFLEGTADGRLLEYNPKTGETKELLGNLFFANGVQLTRDKTEVLVAETMQARIWRYNILSGKASVWVENLPGFPDNIRLSKSTAGAFWVGMALVRQRGKSLLDSLSHRPWLRGQLAKFVQPNFLVYLSKISFADTKAVAVELDESGKIKRSIQDTTGTVIQSVSEIEDTGDTLYMGSYQASYLGMLETRHLS